MSVIFDEDLDEYIDTDFEAESMKDNTLRPHDIETSRTPKAQPLGNVSGELIETLADIEHERWSSWMNWLYKHGTWADDGSFTIQADKAKRWFDLSIKRYEELDEPTKEYDRIEVRKTLSAIKNRLPKEKHSQYAERVSEAFEEEQGWNHCLAEVKQALDIESES